MGVRLSPELIFAKVAALEPEFTFDYGYDRVILKSAGSEKVCEHKSGWFKKTKAEYKLKRVIGSFDWNESENQFSFKVYGKDFMAWGTKFAENLSSALGADITLRFEDFKKYEDCPGDHSTWF